MSPVEGSASLTSGFWRDTVMGCFRCDGCGALNIAIGKGRPGTQDPLDWLASRSNLSWQPQTAPETPEHHFPDVPSQIADAASEAYACREFADGCRAAVLLARSVIEATAKDKGVTEGGLFAKIDAMSEMIRPHVRDGAHQIRLFGNDVAHGDFIQDVSPEDADLVLTLMSEVLHDVYQSPAVVKRAQDARARKQQAPQATTTSLSILVNSMANQKVAFPPMDPIRVNAVDQTEPKTELPTE
jgi:hypothetical protein